MTIKRLCLVLALFFLVAVASFAELFVPAGQKTTNPNYLVPVLDEPTNGFLTVATATLSVGTSTAVIVGTLPVGTKVLEIWAFDNDVNVGGSGVSTGSKVSFIASGSFKAIHVATTTPAIYLRGRTGTGTHYLNAR